MEKKHDAATYMSKLFEDVDEERVRLAVDNLRDEFPGLTNHQLCQKLIEKEAFLCGLVGACTGALPHPWSILGIAPDLITLISKQSSLVLSIAYVFGFEPNTKERAVEVVGCIGTSFGAVAGTYGIKKLVERRIQRELINELMLKIFQYFSTQIPRRFVPILGAIGGAGFNFGSVKAVGSAAIRYYSTRVRDETRKEGAPQQEFIPDVRAIEEQKEKEKAAETTPIPDGEKKPEGATVPIPDGEKKPEGATVPIPDGEKKPESATVPIPDGEKKPESATVPIPDGEKKTEGATVPIPDGEKKPESATVPIPEREKKPESASSEESENHSGDTDELDPGKEPDAQGKNPGRKKTKKKSEDK